MWPPAPPHCHHQEALGGTPCAPNRGPPLSSPQAQPGDSGNRDLAWPAHRANHRAKGVGEACLFPRLRLLCAVSGALLHWLQGVALCLLDCRCWVPALGSFFKRKSGTCYFKAEVQVHVLGPDYGGHRRPSWNIPDTGALAGSPKPPRNPAGRAATSTQRPGQVGDAGAPSSAPLVPLPTPCPGDSAHRSSAPSSRPPNQVPLAWRVPAFLKPLHNEALPPRAPSDATASRLRSRAFLLPAGQLQGDAHLGLAEKHRCLLAWLLAGTPASSAQTQGHRPGRREADRLASAELSLRCLAQCDRQPRLSLLISPHVSSWKQGDEK